MILALPNDPHPPPPQTPQYITILMTEREGPPLSFCRILAPPPTIPKLLTILMTEMRDAIIFVGFWRPPMPPPSPDATILNYLNDRERRAPLSFVGFWRPPMPPPPSDVTILNYLTDREGGGCRWALPFVGFWRPLPRRHNT